ncbi:MarR family winged helix-turn-helix transcriptional regulator [Brevibacterium jeotgali]|uniref:DNA-binding transcriptional regulator, MarR family n=1 Tax=Brevibacterium jeotgali TaxID=1262550 RepID=A0A2H1L2R3_9MICO|nr:MarR family transcriptional regulator [Brevibacterium jeotgali]TWC02402.1 DNA-binding MarR family transcriptional regulator [Brevibacterium jeotgali]SMY11194.1 DNA-binding transcriptional regulator, MarR family [Brevibacterium jeotgali]
MTTDPGPTAERDLLRLDEQVCFALAVASRTVVAMYGPHLAPLGITHPQYLVMLALWEEAPRHQGELARTVRLEPATLSPLLTRLEKIGYIQRVSSSGDARVRLVGLTEEGRAARKQAEAIPAAILADLDMDIDELASLRDSLSELIVRAEKAGDERA